MKIWKHNWAVFSLETCCLLAISLFLVLNPSDIVAHAKSGVLFVSTTGAGTACTQSSPCDLQTALTQAVDGDTLYVAGGTYTGTGTGTGTAVVIVNKSITLYGGWDGAPNGVVGRDPVAHPTIFDGEGQRRVMWIVGNICPTVDGFFVTNGRASGGAGIAIYPYHHPEAAAVIRNNVIINNAATGGWGGGIHIEGGGRPLIEHNRIMSNTTPYEGGGVAIAFESCTTLKNNLIAGNSAGKRGAGIRLRDTWTTLLNNTIAQNAGAGGDGIYAAKTTITLTNNIIVSNTYGLRTDGTLTTTIRHNDVWGNATMNYSGLLDPTGSDGNISLDPLFVSGPDGDYYLSQTAAGQVANSPAVDSGSDSASNLTLHTRTTRTDGQADSGLVDMGYHYKTVERVYLPQIHKN